MVRKSVWWVFVAMAALALWRGIPHDGPSLYAWGEKQSDTAKEWVDDLVSDLSDDELLGGGGGKPSKKSGKDTPANGTVSGRGTGSGSTAGTSGGQDAVVVGSANAATPSWKGLVVTNTTVGSYNRDQWYHWRNIAGRSCWSVREEVLARQVRPGTATMFDAAGRRTDDVGRACEITGGVWEDPYGDGEFTNPSDLDIDHVVALGNAGPSGGNAWSDARRSDYANDLTDGHLLAVSASQNRSKGDQSPDEWLPDTNQCEYVSDWLTVKKRYSLTVTVSERDAMQRVLQTC